MFKYAAQLVEQIDNANSEYNRTSSSPTSRSPDRIDLEKLKMWEPLHALLLNSSPEIQRQTLWVLGTAVQNNPAAQHSVRCSVPPFLRLLADLLCVQYLALSPLPALLSFLTPTVRSGKTRSKAVYALSSLLRHNAAAVVQMADAGGWAVLRDALQDSDITVRRKVAFLFSSLLIPTSEPAQQSTNAQQPRPVPPSASLSLGPPQPQSQSVTLHPSSSPDRKSTRLNSSHSGESRMPSSA